MRRGNSRLLFACAAALLAIGTHAAVSPAGPSGLTNVTAANPKVAGFNYPNVLSPQLDELIVAQGSMKLENPAPAGPNNPGIPTTDTTGTAR